MDIEALRAIGLSEGEVRVYLALLKTGLTTSGDIIKESKMQSSSVYHILNRLIERGMVSSEKKNNRAYFYAGKPDELIDILDQKKKDIERDKQTLLSLIPHLLSLQSKGKKPKQEVLIYEGWQGVLSAFKEAYRTLKPGTPTYAYTITREYGGADPQQVRWLIDKIRELRIELNKKFKDKIKMKIIAERGSDIGEDQAKTPHTIVKYIDRHYVNPAIINIYGEVTVIALWLKNPLAFYIVSKEVSDSFLNNFDLLWKSAQV